MNDPWLPVMAALSGKRIATPTAWPVRKVYRIEGYVADAVAAARRRDRALAGCLSDTPSGSSGAKNLTNSSDSSEWKGG